MCDCQMLRLKSNKQSRTFILTIHRKGNGIGSSFSFEDWNGVWKITWEVLLLELPIQLITFIIRFAVNVGAITSYQSNDILIALNRPPISGHKNKFCALPCIPSLAKIYVECIKLEYFHFRFLNESSRVVCGIVFFCCWLLLFVLSLDSSVFIRGPSVCMCVECGRYSTTRYIFAAHLKNFN